MKEAAMQGVATHADEVLTPMTPRQKRTFWAAWAGWMVDGLDSFIFSLVLVPALREVLPKSGIPATAANVGYYSGLLFALFMVGWGLAMVWGPVADRFGRARTLMLTVLWFSVFTFMAGLSNGLWSLAAFRFLAGLGIGGEWSIGASLVSEEMPESRRVTGGCYMHTGYYFGFLVAAAANYFIGSVYGWRVMFMVGGLPALMAAFLFNRVHEPEKWKKAAQESGGKIKMTRSFEKVFAPQYRTRTILNAFYLIASIVGLWAGSVYVPTAVNYLVNQAGGNAAEAARMGSYATGILGIGTIIGALLTPALAARFDRRTVLGIFFAFMMVFLPVTFGYIFYLKSDPLMWFMIAVFFLGVGGANFAVYSFWIPEQYSTDCRVSAFAFTTNVGRFVGAGLTYLVGYLIRSFGTLGTPVALTAIVFAAALLLLPFAVEIGRAHV